MNLPNVYISNMFTEVMDVQGYSKQGYKNITTYYDKVSEKKFM